MQLSVQDCLTDAIQGSYSSIDEPGMTRALLQWKCYTQINCEGVLEDL